MSTILHGLPLMTTKPFFLNAEHCIGKVREEPASATSKLCSSSAILFYVCVWCSGDDRNRFWNRRKRKGGKGGKEREKDIAEAAEKEEEKGR